MNNIKKLIIFFMILIVIFIIILLVVLNNLNSNENVEGDPGLVIDYDNVQIEDVTSNIEFYNVVSCVNRFINSTYLTDEFKEDEEMYEIFKQNIYEMLSEKYIQENNITVDNLQNNVEIVEENVLFVPLKMKVLEGSNVGKYLVYGFIEDMEYNYIKDIYLFVNLNNRTHYFSIEPINEKIDFETYQYQNENVEIEENESNVYTEVTVNYEYISREHINNYKRIVLAQPELFYNNYLGQEYREKRFGSLENFESYVQKNRQEIVGLTLSQYLVNNYENYVEYVCRDANRNLYIFRESNPMQYELSLDTYTIDSDNFIEEYNSSDERNKIMLNIDRWVQMINARDYRTSYNVLDKTFRENNFGTETDFENYMRQNFPSRYSVEYGEYTEQGQLGIQTIYLTDISNKNNRIEKTIIMQLQEGTDFIMSFNVE